MRKFIPVSILCLAAMFHCACSSETHYDSVSTYATLDVAKALNSDQELSLYHRFHFDRDVVPLQSMELVEAWISSPEIYDADNPLAKGEFSINLVREMNISIIDQNNSNTAVYWLTVEPSSDSPDQARFTEMNVGDLRAYMSSAMKLEIKIDVTLDTYQATRYWRDVCQLGDACVSRLPLSMQFKMED